MEALLDPDEEAPPLRFAHSMARSLPPRIGATGEQQALRMAMPAASKCVERMIILTEVT